MDNSDVFRAYKRWAPIYDRSFGVISGRGRKAAVERLNRIKNARILEVGVGTGLSLNSYAKGSQVIGIDLSQDMLALASLAVQRAGAGNVLLSRMDAGALAFADETFDAITAMFVMTVVPEPATVMRELVRVLKPGGQAIIVNHFSQNHGFRGRIERGLARYSRLLGWNPVFPVDQVMVPQLKLIERIEIAPLGLFTLLRFEKLTDARQN